MLNSCTRPELITEMTLQPVRRYDVDAAILFTDIVVPVRGVGMTLQRPESGRSSRVRCGLVRPGTAASVNPMTCPT